jgi:hypothetical protein
MEKAKMVFYDTDEKRLASDELKPIPLYKGMKITIQDHAEDFRVVEWSYRHGQAEEGASLKIIMERSPALEIKTKHPG